MFLYKSYAGDEQNRHLHWIKQAKGKHAYCSKARLPEPGNLDQVGLSYTYSNIGLPVFNGDFVEAKCPAERPHFFPAGPCVCPVPGTKVTRNDLKPEWGDQKLGSDVHR